MDSRREAMIVVAAIGRCSIDEFQVSTMKVSVVRRQYYCVGFRLQQHSAPLIAGYLDGFGLVESSAE